MSELYLVRHAQASFGATDYDQLSDLGKKQSRWLGNYFLERGKNFERLIVGDMRRHHQTLDGICEGMGQSDRSRIVMPGLNEYDFSKMTANYAKYFPDDPELVKLNSDPHDKKQHYRLLRVVLSAWARDNIPEIPETWEQFSGRVQEAREQIQSETKVGEKVLAIGSGGSNSAFLGQVLKAPSETVFDLNLQSKNTGISCYFFNELKISLSSFNMVPHLDNEELSGFVTYG